MTNELKGYLDNNKNIANTVYAWQEGDGFRYYKAGSVSGELKELINNL